MWSCHLHGAISLDSPDLLMILWTVTVNDEIPKLVRSKNVTFLDVWSVVCPFGCFVNAHFIPN